MSITHDQNFKNLILDYPLQALQLFAASEAPSSTDKIEITPIRQEQLKDRLGDRFFELDVPLKLEWPDGRQEMMLFVLEEQSDPRRFSIYKLVMCCTQLAELMRNDRVVPVVIFLRSSRNLRKQLHLGPETRRFLSFDYLAVELDQLPARQYFHATNIVARILLPLMRHAKQERARVYGYSVQGLLTLEPDPELQRKYLDLIDSALPLTDNERQQYERAFPREQTIMATLSERWKAEGIRQGMQQGLAQGERAGRYQMLAHLLEKRFGALDVDTVSRLAGASTAELDQWAERTLDAGSLQEVFEVH
ncbi:MAG: hypothetical protein Q4B17_08385 [Lautropia sp.]|nr:hypothetical protein [Lautropia sp.]